MNPSPRKIKLFEETIPTLNKNYDIFRIKYDFDEVHAYETGRKFFLDHPQYTHMAILPDVLLVYQEDIDILMKDVEDMDPDIIAGVCNFAYSNKRFFNHMSIIELQKYEAAEIMRRTGKFRWPGDIMTRERFYDLQKQNNPIIRCAHIAFSFPIIRRDIVKLFAFRANAMGVDTAYSQDCLVNNVEMYADVRVEMMHMKGMEFNRDMSNVINFAFNNRIDTLVHKGTLTRPLQREEVFLPRIEEVKE